MTSDSKILPPGIPTANNDVALDAVRHQAQAQANDLGATLLNRGLRLFEGNPRIEAPTEPPKTPPTSPFALGRTYELLLAPDARRKAGAHLTPEAVARSVVSLLPPSRPGDRVLDPAVGGAAFLLAAADQLVDAGAEPDAVLDQLAGFDIDEDALAVAEAALGLWAIGHGIEPRALPSLVHGDGLLSELPEADRIVGNPPFLTQLRAASTHSATRREALRERWGDLVGAYTDDAWLFLAAGVDALSATGSLALVQPVSILAARHAAEIREQIGRAASLRALWVARDRVFDAAVQVCGVVATRAASPSVDLYVGADFSPIAEPIVQPGADGWGAAASVTFEVPQVLLSSERTVGDIANATAGFRDQFYGFVPYVSEAGEVSASDEEGEPRRRLVTVGMIDALHLAWGTRAFSFAKQKYSQPVVDVDALRAGDPKLAAWVDDRSQPKILMATQTRVVEVWVDADGTAVPATPVLSIEPRPAGTGISGARHDPQERLWLLAAALTAPPVSAHFQAAKFGTAMALTSLKLAARDVLGAPLPTNEDAWGQAAALIRDASAAGNAAAPTHELLAKFGELMCQAYEVSSASVLPWWLERI